MTHDELLAKINNFTCCSGAHELALCAVVELHKCSNPRFDLLCDCGTAYPCPTIQKIMDELK